MAEIQDKAGSLKRNLTDAGCDEKTKRYCMACFAEGGAAKMLPALETHRKTLLEALHRAQKRIDCLDYLLFRIRQEEAEKNGNAKK